MTISMPSYAGASLSLLRRHASPHLDITYGCKQLARCYDAVYGAALMLRLLPRHYGWCAGPPSQAPSRLYHFGDFIYRRRRWRFRR